ncbi:SMODS domain-containing nucleotidyltransferase [Anaerotignum lactatifermentans]|uniref:SMODS domain-containing nucleotidyltransferase n=1 Tax=Anaerotignum lactatifermentans TaxID=160404 RepID=UPI001874C33C|nr:nucleotidyltransferase domain-containing protein [Anaerotignum lactatifermentans]MBE5076477.1 nucleotidyltransferase domain-containing protein [Anaerotignum lactatifermentans]
MSINTYLKETASNLIIKGNEKESIDVSLNTFKDRMRDYFSKNESVNLKEIKIFGSYERDTNLPQSVDYGTDVDIMLVMDNDGATPQTYLNRVRRGVEAKYSTSQIRQSSPTVVLKMLHIKFEIVPAIKEGGLYKIKNNLNEWMYTFCATDFNNLTTANKNNYHMVKPLIRLLKYWNVCKNYKAFNSYELEKIIVNHYQTTRYQGYDLKTYVLTGMNELYRLSKYNYQRERLDKAIYNLKEAIEDEDKYPLCAMSEIKEVIGEL